jgi:glycogen debranching enzyme
MPLYAGLPGKEQTRLLVEKHLLNQDEYAPDGQRTHFFAPTTSKNNPYFDPVKYWRGPIWVNTNWLLFEGLYRYDEHRDLADRIRSDTLELLDRNGFFEYFDPSTGKGLGTENFSWSAALALVLLATE